MLCSKDIFFIEIIIDLKVLWGFRNIQDNTYDGKDGEAGLSFGGQFYGTIHFSEISQPLPLRDRMPDAKFLV